MKCIKFSILSICALAFFACSTEENPNNVDEAEVLENLEPAEVEKLLVEEAGVQNAEALQVVKGVNNAIEVQYETFTTIVEENAPVFEEAEDGSQVAVRRSNDVKVTVEFDGEDVLWVTQIKGEEVMTVRRLENSDLEVQINDAAGSIDAKIQDGALQVAFADNAGNKYTIIERNGGGVTVSKNNVVIEN